MSIAGWAVGAVLAVFTLRRLLFWLASLLPPRPSAPWREPDVAVLVAARNEAAHLPRLLAALELLDYPRERLRFVVVSDGSTDATPEIARDWAARVPGAQALVLADRRGKGAALQAGLALAGTPALVAVFDADTLPRPDALAVLAGAFRDPRVGAACGYPDPGRDHPTAAARYAALERWVSHLVTFAGKDRLGLDPPVIGALFCVRLAALAAAGGFPADDAEDIALSQALARGGWRTRWLRDAVAREDVPGDFAALRRQRLRWSRGLLRSAPRAGGIEGRLAAAGYLDRVALAAGLALAAAGALPPWLIAAYAAAPALVIATALARARVAPGAYLAAMPPLALADIALTFESVLRRAPPGWREWARGPSEAVTRPACPASEGRSPTRRDARGAGRPDRRTGG